ncbi:MAG: TetR family transcriptional regulator C-terminal domain-containing protein [Sphingobium sp.]
MPNVLTTDSSADTARRLLSFMQGIAVQAMFDPDDWPVERQSRLAEEECAQFLGN